MPLTQRTKNSLRQALGNTIKERRDVQGISQYALADLMGSTQPRIVELEKGDTKNIDTYMECITALGGRITITWKPA